MLDVGARSTLALFALQLVLPRSRFVFATATPRVGDDSDAPASAAVVVALATAGCRNDNKNSPGMNGTIGQNPRMTRTITNPSATANPDTR